MRSPKLLVSLTLAALAASSMTPIHAAVYNAAASAGELFKAVEKGDSKAVAELLKDGAQVDETGTFGATPLMRAAYRGDAATLKQLLEAGADANLQDSGGSTALHIATRRGQDDVVNILLQRGANVNAQDKEGWTALMRAALGNSPAILTRLLDAGADINLTNSQGETALMHAISSRNVDSARAVLARGADTGITTRYGDTAVSIARRSAIPEMQFLLTNRETDSAANDTKAETVAESTAAKAAPAPATKVAPEVALPEIGSLPELAEAQTRQAPELRAADSTTQAPSATAATAQTEAATPPAPPVMARPEMPTADAEPAADVPWVVRIPEDQPMAKPAAKPEVPPVQAAEPALMPWQRLSASSEANGVSIAPLVTPRRTEQPDAPVLPVVPPVTAAPEQAAVSMPMETSPVAPAEAMVAPETAAELVEVGEAIYVPPQNELMQDAPAATTLIQNKRPIWGSLPSQQAAGKQLWLQVAPFRSRDEAMQFWQQLGMIAPETVNPNYRIRLARPYSATSGRSIALRIGPVSSNTRSEYICAAVQRLGRPLQCNIVREFGKTRTMPKAGRQALTADNRYQRYGMRAAQQRNKPTGSVTTYWVQLGSYKQVSAAQNYMKRLENMYPALISDLKADIITPPNSSANTRIYRLQVGPFTVRDQAESRCNALRSQRVSCLVVSNRN